MSQRASQGTATHQMLPLRAQFTSWSTLLTTYCAVLPLRAEPAAAVAMVGLALDAQPHTPNADTSCSELGSAKQSDIAWLGGPKEKRAPEKSGAKGAGGHCSR